MFFVCVSNNGHETVGEDGDEDCYDQKVANDQEQTEEGLCQQIVLIPDLPRGRSKPHKHLEQCVCRISGAGVPAGERQRKCHEKSRAADHDENEDSSEVHGHHAECNKELTEVSVMVQRGEEARKQQDCCGCQYV